MSMLILAAAMLAASSAPLGAQQLGARPPVVRTAPFAPGDTITVRLGRGDVHIRPGRPGQVRVTLHALPGSGADPLPVESLAVVERSAAGVKLAGTAANRAGRGVGVVLEVPETSVVQVQLERGDIRAGGISGSITASTTRGDVVLEQFTGNARVDVTNGDIRAAFSRLSGAEPSVFATLNGNVDITLAGDARAALEVRCRGCTLRELAPGVPLRRTRLLGRTPDAVILAAEGRLGGGGAELKVFAWNGEVAIRVDE